jgi:ribosomal subunit interface protein
VKDEALSKLSKVERFADRATELEITFSEEHNPRIEYSVQCEVILRVRGATIHATASAADPLKAIDAVQDKLMHQVRKLKEKAVERSHGRPASNGDGAGPARE